jgi:hypothetical protein
MQYTVTCAVLKAHIHHSRPPLSIPSHLGSRWASRESRSPALDRWASPCRPPAPSPGTVRRGSPAVRTPPPAPPASCRRAAPILYSSAWPERWPVVPAAKPHCPPRPRSAADAALAPAHHRPGNVPHECETRSAPPAARESRSGIATPPRFPALRLRSVDNARAAVLPPPRQSSGESAAGTGVCSLFRAFARAGRDGLWAVGGRRGRLGAWRHATLLPTAAADARSPLSALRSRALSRAIYSATFSPATPPDYSRMASMPLQSVQPVSRR